MNKFINIKVKLLLFLFLLIHLKCNRTNKQEVTTELIKNPISLSEADTSILPRIEWKTQTYHLGVLIQGEKASYVFKFKNVGKSPLIISSVMASCGCTVANYDKRPIPPGEEGYIEVIFDSSGRHGFQSKTITIVANTQPSTHELKITADVVKID